MDKVYAVVDVETTMNGPEDDKASPFDPSNKLVAVGLLIGSHNRSNVYYDDGGKLWLTTSDQENAILPIGMLVGHNLVFDLHYLRKSGWLQKGWQKSTTVWDTQLAEYLLSGQSHLYPSLDQLTEKYVGPQAVKDTTVTAFFEAGKGADHVPRHLLTPYLVGDIENTHKIFLAQVERAIEQNMLPLIQVQMDALLAVEEMTFNGMHLDADALAKGLKQTERECMLHTNDAHFLLNALGRLGHVTNLQSAPQLSRLFFGGQLVEQEQEQQGHYKNGKPKFKSVKKVIDVRPLVDASYPKGPVGKGGHYSVDDAQLERLSQYFNVPGKENELAFVQAIRKIRELQKQLTTYWMGLSTLLNVDGTIHQNISLCSTRTGRSSCSRPNLQNITNGAIKKVFNSRWERGIIIEADYGQLEMIELAIQSKDKQLMEDIKNGVDMHNALHQSMYGKPLDPKDRKNFKRCSFALIYGAGPAAIAEQGKISMQDAKRFIDVFYQRYADVKIFHDTMINCAKAERQPTSEKTEHGYPRGEAVLVDKNTHRLYTFKEYDAPDFMKQRGIHTSFSPTELKNYFVQGGATGDKVPLAYGLMLRVLKNNPRLADKCLLINTVHDSIMFDCHPDVFEEAVGVIRNVMEVQMPCVFESVFNVKLPLKYTVGISCGPNWLDQKEIAYERS